MQVNTTVKTVDIDSLDEFFPTGEDVIIPQTTPAAKTVLTPDEEIDLDPTTLTKPVAAAAAAEPVEETPLSFDELMEQNTDDNKKAGRSKTDKSGIVELYSKKISDGHMVPFDDFKGDPADADYKEKLEDYLSKLSTKDLEELWDANIERQVNEVEERVPQEFYDSLPRELQFAAKYVADGGNDLKSLFRALAHVEEVRQLDPEVEQDQEAIVRQYLKAKDFGTDEEIDEEIDSKKDLGKLAGLAASFKPKLDKMREQMVERQLQEQEDNKKAREDAALQYVQNVNDSLKDMQIGEIKVDKKTNDFLINGLTRAAYPSMSGKPTNLLGHLLEKHQVHEPNPQLVAEALWLLADPAGYRAKLMEKGGSKENEKTIRALKTEQSSRNASTVDETSSSARRAVPRGVTRPVKSVLAR